MYSRTMRVMYTQTD